MYYFFSKALGPFLLPLNAFLLVVVLTYFSPKRYERWARIILAFAFGTILTLSIPWTAQWFTRMLQPTPVAIADVPVTDVIVVLGGSTLGPYAPRLDSEEISGSRLAQAAKLYHRGKAKFIIVSGGEPARATDGSLRTAADDMRDILQDWGVPREAILLENASRNTLENAQLSIKIIRERKWKKVTLVTGAYHLKRAGLMFQRPDLEVFPFPSGVDTHYPLTLQNCYPQVEALLRSTQALREIYGIISFKMRGWFTTDL